MCIRDGGRVRKSDERATKKRARGARGEEEGEGETERETRTHTRGARRCTDGMKNEKEQLRWRLAVNRD